MADFIPKNFRKQFKLLSNQRSSFSLAQHGKFGSRKYSRYLPHNTSIILFWLQSNTKIGPLDGVFSKEVCDIAFCQHQCPNMGLKVNPRIAYSAKTKKYYIEKISNRNLIINLFFILTLTTKRQPERHSQFFFLCASTSFNSYLLLKNQYIPFIVHYI